MNKKYTVSVVLECFITVLFTECKYKDECSSIQTIKLMNCIWKRMDIFICIWLGKPVP